ASVFTGKRVSPQLVVPPSWPIRVAARRASGTMIAAAKSAPAIRRRVMPLRSIPPEYRSPRGGWRRTSILCGRVDVPSRRERGHEHRSSTLRPSIRRAVLDRARRLPARGHQPVALLELAAVQPSALGPGVHLGGCRRRPDRPLVSIPFVARRPPGLRADDGALLRTLGRRANRALHRMAARRGRA